jgi:isohexenylglutaconyl-CoA hydratase
MKPTFPALNTLILEKDRAFLRIWLNRPERRNALSEEMASELATAFDHAAKDPVIRAVVLRGAGGTFCAGGDLKGFGAQLDRDVVVSGSRSGGALFQYINRFPKPVVVLLEGAAIAGGLGLACAADVVVATRNTRFSLTETLLGLVPAQIAPLVVDRIGTAQARYLTLTAARFDAETASRLGLVHLLAEDADHLEQIANDLLNGIGRCSPNAMALTKQILHECVRWPVERRPDIAAEHFADALLSEDGQEGLRAFAERRDPMWVEQTGE